MPHSISTLLIRNLHDVFGEGDPARRRAAIDEIFSEDCAFYEPTNASAGGVTRSERLPWPRRDRSRRSRDQGYSP
jgi:hypothetical protein